jgi:hypothetical protein
LPLRDYKNKAEAASSRRTQENDTTSNNMMYFNRVATFFPCQQLNYWCNTDTVTSAETMVATSDGMKVLYTDPLLGVVGAVNITDIFQPRAAGSVNVGGSPTSIATCPGSNNAIVVVDTSAGDKVNPSGVFHVIAMDTLAVLYTGDLGT